MVREQSICGLGCKHSSFGILSHEVSTDKMKSVCIKTMNLLSLYRYKTTILAYKKAKHHMSLRRVYFDGKCVE